MRAGRSKRADRLSLIETKQERMRLIQAQQEIRARVAAKVHDNLVAKLLENGVLTEGDLGRTKAEPPAQAQGPDAKAADQRSNMTTGAGAGT